MLEKTNQTADNFLRANAITEAAPVTFATLAAAFLNTLGLIVVSAIDGVFGYVAGNGHGSTVTQATSRSTGVTLSKATGKITTTADSLAAATTVTFTVTNTKVAATDVIIISKVSGDADTLAFVSAVAAGSFDVTLYNTHAANADTTAFVFNFAVIKGSIT